jgi:hypothetical protein
MKRISTKTIDSILVAVSIATLAFLAWFLLDQTDYFVQHPRYEKCVTEDQPGYCIWNGEVRYYEDNVNIQR